jgi:hypothetical protein
MKTPEGDNLLGSTIVYFINKRSISINFYKIYENKNDYNIFNKSIQNWLIQLEKIN